MPGLGHPEPPLRLQDVLELLKLDREFYTADDPGVLCKVVSCDPGPMLSGQRGNDLAKRKKALLAPLVRTENGLAMREIVANLAFDASE